MKNTSLKNCTVLVTRPMAQSRQLCALLHADGATALSFPLISIVPDSKELSQLAEKVHDADWLIFISPSAIDMAQSRLPRLPPHLKLACVGQPSAAKLAQYYPDHQIISPAEGNGAERLLQHPAMTIPLQNQKIVLIGGHAGRTELPETLAQRGATIVYAKLYHREPHRPAWQLFDDAIQSGTRLAACITSVQIASLLFDQAGINRQATLQSLTYCVSHRRIAEHLARLGATEIVITEAGDQQMVAALCQRFSRP